MGFTRYAERRHALAALCLYGQPFGFTREDVAAVREAAEAAGEPCDACEQAPMLGRRWKAPLLALADRLDALLPPEEP